MFLESSCLHQGQFTLNQEAPSNRNLPRVITNMYTYISRYTYVFELLSGEGDQILIQSPKQERNFMHVSLGRSLWAESYRRT